MGTGGVALVQETESCKDWHVFKFYPPSYCGLSSKKMRGNWKADIFWLNCLILESHLDPHSPTNKKISAKERYIKNVDSLVWGYHLTTRTHFFLHSPILTPRKTSNYMVFGKKNKCKSSYIKPNQAPVNWKNIALRFLLTKQHSNGIII